MTSWSNPFARAVRKKQITAVANLSEALEEWQATAPQDEGAAMSKAVAKAKRLVALHEEMKAARKRKVPDESY